jgi:hypothetical protein
MLPEVFIRNGCIKGLIFHRNMTPSLMSMRSVRITVGTVALSDAFALLSPSQSFFSAMDTHTLAENE